MPANFYSEGVAATLNTKTKLLNELFLNTSLAFQQRIRNMELIGDDVAFEAKNGQYLQKQLSFDPMPGLTAYLDLDGHIHN